MPIPKANAPNAPWVAVWLSPHTMVMPGWVAEIREEFFGPDGGNGEMDALLAEMRAWVKDREREKHNAF